MVNNFQVISNKKSTYRIMNKVHYTKIKIQNIKIFLI